MKQYVFYFILPIIALVFNLAQASFSKPKSKVGLLPIQNKTKNKNFKYLSQQVMQQWMIYFSQHKEIKIIKIKNTPKNQTIKFVSEKYPELDYAILTHFIQSEGDVITLKTVIYDLINGKELDKVNLYLPIPLTIKSYQNINNMASNILWAIIGIPFNVFSDPDDVEIYINKKFIGRTPLKKLRGKEGKHQILVYKKGYEIIKDDIVLKRNQENTLYYPLKIKNFLKSKNKISLRYPYSFIDDTSTQPDLFVPMLFSFEHFIENVSFEIEIGIINFERNTPLKNFTSLKDIKTITVVPLSLSIKYHFFQEEFLSPYFGVGGGVAFISVAELKSGQTNPWFFLSAGMNLGFINLSEGSSRIGFFVEGRYFNGGKIRVGEATFNPLGPKTHDNTEISIEGFQFIAGLSYIFF